MVQGLLTTNPVYSDLVYDGAGFLCCTKATRRGSPPHSAPYNSDCNLFALQNSCVRASWCTLFPRYLFSCFDTFRPRFRTLFSALLVNPGSVPGTKRTTTVLVSLGLVQILFCIGVGGFDAISGPLRRKASLPLMDHWRNPALYLFYSWCYVFLRPLIETPIITPMDPPGVFSRVPSCCWVGTARQRFC
ncbi:hypothetical protein B0H12DRAFT_6535 [Mycena haematopus]|nr:hypothetical protein B0H12DRAFT_6535 [Mycena haematopus]